MTNPRNPAFDPHPGSPERTPESGIDPIPAGQPLEGRPPEDMPLPGEISDAPTASDDVRLTPTRGIPRATPGNVRATPSGADAMPRGMPRAFRSQSESGAALSLDHPGALTELYGDPLSALRPIVFSAPFGNYLHGPHVTSTLGTFTLKRRGGWPHRLWRIARTLRYSPMLRAWTNKLGLPNPGIEAIFKPSVARKLPGRILSIHGFTGDGWRRLIERVAAIPLEHGPVALELNVSCPNVTDEPYDYRELFRRALATHIAVIVKIPPVGWRPVVEQALEAGVHGFHATNTLPVDRGGLSGKPLMPIALRVVEELRQRYPENAEGTRIRIIGGGGVTTEADVERYRAAGADHVAIGSGLLLPWRIARMHKLAEQWALHPAPR